MAGVMREVGAVAGLPTNVPGGPQMPQAYWRGSRERSTAATATAARQLETPCHTHRKWKGPLAV